MKIYTEEEIRKFIQTNIIEDEDDLDLITPIELPSDEDIKEMRKPYIEHINTMVHADLERDGYLGVGFIAGAEYVINKIQGGNK
jgi:hypothetical protein